MSEGFYERLFGIRGKVALVMEDAAGLTMFLSSRAGSHLTGQTIPCDGGATTIG